MTSYNLFIFRRDLRLSDNNGENIKDIVIYMPIKI